MVRTHPGRGILSRNGLVVRNSVRIRTHPSDWNLPRPHTYVVRSPAPDQSRARARGWLVTRGNRERQRATLTRPHGRRWAASETRTWESCGPRQPPVGGNQLLCSRLQSDIVTACGPSRSSGPRVGHCSRLQRISIRVVWLLLSWSRSPEEETRRGRKERMAHEWSTGPTCVVWSTGNQIA